MKEYFGQFGVVTSVKQIYKQLDKGTEKIHKGVGYIEYEDPDSVDRVVLMCVHVIKERDIEAKKALTETQMRALRQREDERNERIMREREMSMMNDMMCANPMFEMMNNMMMSDAMKMNI